MHELGIVYEVIKIVDGFVEENNITKVDKIVLEIGQLSQAILSSKLSLSSIL